MRKASLMLALAFSMLCAIDVASGMRFDLVGSDTKCLSEELETRALVVATYRVVAETPANVSAKVTSPQGNSLHLAEHIDNGEFAFTTTESGDHMACFWIPGASSGTIATIELDWKTGVAAKDWAFIAKREKIDGIELELRKLEEMVIDINEEMMYLRERDNEMLDINDTTNKKMAWFSMGSLCICLIVAGLQLWYLKSFFQRKKIL